jgi:hypothetical protein
MPEYQTVWHPISPVSGMKKTNDAGTGPVLDQVDEVRHFFGWYRTEIMIAGMLMPALVCSMPVHSYVSRQYQQHTLSTFVAASKSFKTSNTKREHNA